MPYQVQVGAQVVEFPDSVNPEEAQRILADQFPPTGADVAQALQDPDFIPTREQFDLFKEYNKTKQTDWINTIAQSVDAAASMMGSALAEGATGAAVNPLNYIEGAAQGTRQLYGLVAQSENPDSPLFKFKDLVTGTGTPDSQYNQFLEARDFAKLSRQLESGQTAITAPPELTNPEFVQGVSLIADPTMLLPGIGEVFGAGKLATRAVGKGAQLAGRAVTGVARPLERAAGAAERITAEALGMTPEGLRTAATTAGVAGALGIAPELATAAAIPAGIRTAREVGEAITAAGENLMTQPSRVGPLEAIGAAPGANLRQRMLGVIGQYGGDAAVDAALRGTAGALEGASLGAGLGYLSGGEEGAAAGIGSGGLQGAVGAIGGRAYQKLTGKAAAEARAGDLGRFIEGLQDPTTKGLFERVRDTHGVDAASALMDLEALVKGRFRDIDVEYLSNADFAKKHKGIARGVQFEAGDRPTISINADILGQGKGDSPLYTLGHELFHALEKSEQLYGGATEIKNTLVGRWIQEGDTIRKLSDGVFSDAEIEARFNQYRDKLSKGNANAAAELAQFDTLPKKADFIASELAAEHFARLMAGQKPDTMLRGFSGLARQTLDAALTQNASKAIANAAAAIERTFGVKPTDSVLFPDLKQASPQINAMLRDLVRARRSLDQKIELQGDQGIATLKPSDINNPVAAQQVIDLGLGERLPDGTVRAFSNEEIRVREERDTGEIRRILESVPGARVVDGEILGRFSPEQLSAIEQSQAVSGRMKDKVRAINSAMGNGNSVFVNYGAATRRVKNRLTGKFTSNYSSGIRLSQREVLPYSFYISKADNPVVKVIDITKMRNALDKVTNPDGSVAGLWGNVDGFMSDLAKYFTNLDAKENARRSSEVFGQDKARFLGDFVNEQEKGGRKFVRDLRVDRIGSIDPRSFRANISEDAIQLSKLRWMPSETIGDKLVTNSDEGYRIVSGAKHRLYGPDGKLIGIYDTQTQAERKADATQARLQPEVDQQQRVPGDEGRQTAEAGRGNRPLGGAEGGQEGRQADRTVRQAGDVRFMPVDENTGLPLNPDKTVTVYHHTNKTAAEAIRRTGVLKSAGEPDVYVTTEKSPTTGYGEEVVAIKVDPKKLQIDDQFPDGRTDFRLSVGKPGGSIKVKVDSNVNFMPSDTDYLSAVKAGDTAAAQRMVDEAAKAAGYTVGPVYHGTPTGGFNVFDKAMRGETSGVSRRAFSFTTDKKTAESYSKSLGNDAVRLDAGLRVVNNAMRKFDTDQPTLDYFDSKGYQASLNEALPEFDWGAIDDIPEFIKELKDHARELKDINPQLSKDFLEGAKVMTQAKATPEIKRVFLRIPSNAPVFQATRGTLAMVMRDFSAEAQPTKSGIVELPDNERIYYVADPEQIKSADPITRDDQGNVIPLSQRFQASSADIRFMPDYSGEHRAPQRDSGAPLDNLKDVYPDDVYGPKGALYYGHASGDATDKAAIRIIQSARNKPDAPVKVFRAIPKSIQSNEINPGDWITTIKSYAVQHGEGALGGDYKILEKTVPAGDLYTNGDSIFEFGYDPKFMPMPDSSMPGAYSFTGGYRALPGKSKGSLRIYSPAGNLIGIAASLDEAQRIIRKKTRQ